MINRTVRRLAPCGLAPCSACRGDRTHALPTRPQPMLARLVMRRLPWLALACALCALQGCATVHGAAACDDARNDPLEPLNRRVFAADLALDRALIKPAAQAYRAALPEFLRDRIHALLDNLKQPLVFANDVAAGPRQRRRHDRQALPDQFDRRRGGAVRPRHRPRLRAPVGRLRADPARLGRRPGPLPRAAAVRALEPAPTRWASRSIPMRRR